MFIQKDSPVQPKPALLILDRDSSRSSETVDCFNSLDPEHREPRGEQETCKTLLNAERLCPLQNGTGDHGQSRDEKADPETPAVGDTGKASDKAKCAEWRAEADSVVFSAPSCGNQGEEADTVLGVISAKQGADKSNQEPEAYQRSSETDSSTQSGNLKSQDMGHAQSQDHTPLPMETSQFLQREEGSVDVSRTGDLPEEKEGATNSSSQETENSLALSSHDPEENGQHNDEIELKLAAECSSENGEATLTTIQVNSELNSSGQNDDRNVADPLNCPETGNLSEHTIGNADSVSGLVADDISIKQNSEFSISEGDSSEAISLRPDMAPGPIHKGRGLSHVTETLSPKEPPEEPLDQSQQPPSSSETTSECPETLFNDLICEIKANAGDSEEAFLPERNKEVTPEERPQDLISITDDIAVSDLDKQSEPSDEASHLPFDSEAFITTDVRQGVSTVLSSEPCDVIIGTTLREKEDMKTNVDLDSLSKDVQQIPEERSGDRNSTHELSVKGPEISALNVEQEDMKEHEEERLGEKETDSTSQEAISDLPDRLETTHVSDTVSKPQLPDLSMEGGNTLSDLTVGVNDLVQGLMESTHNQPSQTDEVKISDAISDGCIDTATISNETAVTEDNTDAVGDVVLGLENGSTSDPHGPSSLTAELTSPLDINNELHQDLEHTSSVDTDNSLSTESQPSDITESGLHQDNIECLMEQNETVELHAEEPHAMKGKAFFHFYDFFIKS